MFRSQTDEQLAAKHDPAPYDKNGIRSWTNEHAYGEWVFSPRVECIPSRDPFPYQGPTGSYHANPGWLGEERLTFAPRPEFARPPVNRILKAFRTDNRERYTLSERAQLWLDTTTIGDFTPAEIDHARKVLTRLSKSFYTLRYGAPGIQFATMQEAMQHPAWGSMENMCDWNPGQGWNVYLDEKRGGGLTHDCQKA